MKPIHLQSGFEFMIFFLDWLLTQGKRAHSAPQFNLLLEGRDRSVAFLKGVCVILTATHAESSFSYIGYHLKGEELNQHCYLTHSEEAEVIDPYFFHDH